METLRIDPQTSGLKPKPHMARQDSQSPGEGQAGASTTSLPPNAEKVQPAPGAASSSLEIRQDKSPQAPLALSDEQVEQEVAEINALLQKMGRREILLSVDDESRDVIIHVVDSDSEEVVRQIPPEHVLELRDRLAEMKGILINEEG